MVKQISKSEKLELMRNLELARRRYHDFGLSVAEEDFYDSMMWGPTGYGLAATRSLFSMNLPYIKAKHQARREIPQDWYLRYSRSARDLVYINSNGKHFGNA